MRDLIFIGYLALITLLAVKRPFMFTLIYAYIDIVAPQRLSYFLLNSIPISLIMFGLAMGGYLLYDKKTDSRISPRHGCIVALLLYCWYTTSVADVPLYAAEKWAWVWKALFFAAFLPLLLRTKLRIESLALMLVLCASTLIVTGGIKTMAGGGGYGSLTLLIDDNSGLYESSIISCVAIMIIPLILWLRDYGTIFKPDWRVRAYSSALIFACLLIPIGTQARTGLVCIGVLAILKLRFVRMKYIALYIIGVIAVGMAAFPFLPQTFVERMSTITNYQSDESASTRIAVWKWTWEYVQDDPFGGGFDAFRQNEIVYDIPVEGNEFLEEAGIDEREVVDEGRAYHSSYFEMLGEQGFPGLILWLIIHVGGVWRMEVVRRMYLRRNRADEEWVAPLALALQSAQIIFLVGSLFVGIAFQPFVYMLIAMQLGLDTYLARRRKEAAFKPITQTRLKLAEKSTAKA